MQAPSLMTSLPGTWQLSPKATEQLQREAWKLATEIHQRQVVQLAAPAEATAEVIPFCGYVDRQYHATAHLRLIGEKLGEVQRYIETGGQEGLGRLIITVPPRHGKTLTISKRWPAFILGKHQDWRIALVSYAGELAEDASRSVRALIRDEPLYQQLFPDVELSRESQAVNRWALSGGSADNPNLVAVGVGGPLTGRGFHLVIIDDPIKNRAEAESATIREGLKAWYRGTLRTRLEPGGAIVIIQTRWHEDDLVGYLLEQEELGEGESWTLLNLPALAETVDEAGTALIDPLGREEGDALWPERYERATLLTTRLALGSYDWASQYQGHPKPPGGAKLLREWFTNIVQPDEVPSGLTWMRYWDLAISVKERASFTASCRTAFDEHGNLYIAAMVRGKWEWPPQKRILKATMLAEHKLAVMHGVETAVHGVAAVQEFRTDPELVGIGLRSVSVHTDKLTRALPWIALAESGKVRLVAGRWITDFIDELVTFTGHKDRFDDQIDCVSGCVQMHAQYGTAMEIGANPFYD